MREAVTVRADEDVRLEVVDALRGFALTGLFLVHMIESYELYWARPAPGAIADAVFLLFMGKSFSLLALCFGFSFFILMDRAARRGVDFTRRFAWRLTVLIGIGTLHALVYRGDIIQLLALMGFALLIAHRIKDNRLLVVMAAVSLIGPVLILQLFAAAAGQAWASASPNHWIDPAMRAYTRGDIGEYLRANLWQGQLPKWWFMVETGRLLEILGLYLLGMVLGRIGFFARPGDFVRGRRIALAVALPAAVAIHFAIEPLATRAIDAGYGEAAARALRYLLTSWQGLAGTAVWALLLIALFESPARRLLRPFIPLGRLTLTLYIAQSLVFVPVFYHFGLDRWEYWDQATRLWVGLAAVVVQMWAGARLAQALPLWSARMAWRALTYWSRNVPFRRKAIAAS